MRGSVCYRPVSEVERAKVALQRRREILLAPKGDERLVRVGQAHRGDIEWCEQVDDRVDSCTTGPAESSPTPPLATRGKGGKQKKPIKTEPPPLNVDIIDIANVDIIDIANLP